MMVPPSLPAPSARAVLRLGLRREHRGDGFHPRLLILLQHALIGDDDVPPAELAAVAAAHAHRLFARAPGEESRAGVVGLAVDLRHGIVAHRLGRGERCGVAERGGRERVWDVGSVPHRAGAHRVRAEAHDAEIAVRIAARKLGGPLRGFRRGRGRRWR